MLTLVGKYSVLSYQTSKWAWRRIISSSCFVLFFLFAHIEVICLHFLWELNKGKEFKTISSLITSTFWEEDIEEERNPRKERTTRKIKKERIRRNHQSYSNLECSATRYSHVNTFYEARSKRDYRNIIDTTLINFRQELASG